MYEPVPETQQAASAAATPKFKAPAALLAVALAVGGAGAYSIHEHSAAKTAQDQNAAMLQSLKATNAQVEQLTAKLNELTAPKPAAEVPVQQKHSARAMSSSSHARRVVRRRADDPRWKKMQAQLDEQGKAIASTRDDLTSALNTTKGELNDSIARTHGELVALQRKGERNYYEFVLSKSKQFAYHGSVGIKLRKANVKHQYADLELLVDDRSLTKKHVNIYEPAMFYSSDSEQPVQVVIQSIIKDQIKGYVAEPKYRRADLNAMSQQPAQDGTQQATAQPRQRLSVPQ